MYLEPFPPDAILRNIVSDVFTPVLAKQLEVASPVDEAPVGSFVHLKNHLWWDSSSRLEGQLVKLDVTV